MTESDAWLNYEFGEDPKASKPKPKPKKLGEVPLKQTQQVAVTASTTSAGVSELKPIVIGNQVYENSYNAVVEPVELFPGTTIGDGLTAQANLVLEQFNTVVTDKNTQDIGGKIYLALNDGAEVNFGDTRLLFAHRGCPEKPAHGASIPKTTWLNQSVISMWMQMLVNRGNLIGYGRHINGLQPVGPPPIMFLPSTSIDDIKHNRMNKNAPAKKLISPEFAYIKKPDDPRTIVLFPCNIHSDHWVLYAWCPSVMDVIYYYDSMIMSRTDKEILDYFERDVAPYICMDSFMLYMSHTDKRAISLMQRIQKDYDLGHFRLVINTPRYDVTKPEIPDYEQVGGYDCGIFVCWYAHRIALVGVGDDINAGRRYQFRKNIDDFIKRMIVSFGVGYCTLIDYNRFELLTLGRGLTTPPSTTTAATAAAAAAPAIPESSEASCPSPPPEYPESQDYVPLKASTPPAPVATDDDLMADDDDIPSFKVTITKPAPAPIPATPAQPKRKRITPIAITPSNEEKPIPIFEYEQEKANYEENVLKPLKKAKLDKYGTIYEYDDNGIIYYLADKNGDFIRDAKGAMIKVDPQKLKPGQKIEDIGRPNVADDITEAETLQYMQLERALQKEYSMRLMKWESEHHPNPKVRKRAAESLRIMMEEAGIEDFSELDADIGADEEDKPAATAAAAAAPSAHDDDDIVMPTFVDEGTKAKEKTSPADDGIVYPPGTTFSPDWVLSQTSAPPGGLSRTVVSSKADISKVPPIKNGGERKRAYGKRERGKKLEDRKKSLAQMFPGDTMKRHDDIISQMIIKSPPEKKPKSDDDDDDDDDFESPTY